MARNPSSGCSRDQYCHHVYEDAYEKVLWYCLRWRIEMYFKVLKSGFRVESCRLGHATGWQDNLTVMSIVAWRLFMITLSLERSGNTLLTLLAR